jgi:hypothetical protein
MAEGTLMLGGRHTWFGRAELAAKSSHDLHAHEFPGVIFTVAKVQAGYFRSFGGWKGLVPGVGGSVTLNVVPEALEVQYDGRVRPGLAIFVALRPGRHRM